jgi:hypothetical protein
VDAAGFDRTAAVENSVSNVVICPWFFDCLPRKIANNNLSSLVASAGRIAGVVTRVLWGGAEANA